MALGTGSGTVPHGDAPVRLFITCDVGRQRFSFRSFIGPFGVDEESTLIEQSGVDDIHTEAVLAAASEFAHDLRTTIEAILRRDAVEANQDR
ncbi:MAG: hypothetical protein IT341_07145 [Chloroflexi bacterium]|nr:hypothetical protein [Chloroflexota bacterium]